MVVELNIGVKRCQQITQFSLQHHRPFCRAAVHHGQIAFLREVLDLIEVFLGSPVPLLQLFAGQVLPFRQRRVGQIVCCLGECPGSPAERTRTVTLAISDGSIGPAGREFGINDRLLPGRGIYTGMMVPQDQTFDSSWLFGAPLVRGISASVYINLDECFSECELIHTPPRILEC